MKLRRVDLSSLDPAERRALVTRRAVPDAEVRKAAAAICEEVAVGGDAAMERLAATHGGGFRRVGADELDGAVAGLAPDLRRALEQAIDHVEAVHRAQLPADIEVVTVPGVTVRRRWAPLRRVGAYIPGGKASYPSTVLMTAVPARVAGVGEVVVATPATTDGTVAPAVLAACALVGVNEVWAMGGAQAIAALAYGTESLRPVDKIVGPGNAWVTAAKLAVFGVCGIDLPAGPSEALVIADRHADPRLVAVDLLCQAEHGPDSPAILVTTDADLADRVEEQMGRLLPGLERRQILAAALEEHGLVVVAADRDAALAFADDYAAEHVSIHTDNPEGDAKAIVAAGSVYVGRWSPESAGDYATGANHVLPTGGLAHAYGPLSVVDFGSFRQEQHLTADGLAALRETIAVMATAEGLTAHRLAAEARFAEETQP